MGVRVHKMLGYGLTDVAMSGHTIADPRINSAAPVLTGDTDERHSPEAFLEFLRAKDEQLPTGGTAAEQLTAMRARTGLERSMIADGLTQRRTRFLPEYSVVHRSEGDLPHVLCVKPVSQSSWARSDDLIDWATETYAVGEPGDNGESYVRTLTSGPYPWNGLFMDDRTGDRAPDAIVWWVRVRNRLAQAGENDSDEYDLDELARDGGFNGHDDAVAHCAPWIPTEVRHLCEFAEVFTDPGVVNQLRPMLYTYWA